MVREKLLLSIIFTFLDAHPQHRDEQLRELCEVFNVDMVDMTNLFLDYTWADIDMKDKNEILDNFFKRL